MNKKIKHFLFHIMLGMGEAEFHRTAGLTRNPEGPPEQKCCPVCKKPILRDEQGDLRCENFSLDYERNDGCYWHRYADGLNYWSKPAEILKSISTI